MPTGTRWACAFLVSTLLAAPVVLADGKDLLTPFPQQAGRVTVLSLDEAGVIRSVSYWNPETALVLP